MQPALLIRLRPNGPWRYGPGEGGQDAVDALYRSDRLFSAVTLAMHQLGHLDEWLHATATSSAPAVAFSSLFPFQADTLFVSPPATLWPPPSNLVTSPSPAFLTKTRWSAAHFVPVSIVESILTGQTILADQWIPDPDSGCLLRRDRPSSSPFRTVTRTSAAVDRLTGAAVRLSTSACVEFEPGSGLWTLVRYIDEAARSNWDERVRAAFRLLADTGFGGRRKSGWGQTAAPEFQTGSWPSVILPKTARLSNGNGADRESAQYWMLSLYSPAPSDSIDWSTGHYKLSTRGGRTESTARSGVLKKAVRMITEGSVVSGPSEPVGTAVNVAPDDFPHPVYRSGFALALKLPQQPQAEQGAVETPTDAEALEPQPCAPESQAAEPEHPEGVRESVYSEPEALGVSNSAQTEVSEPTIAEYGEAHEEAPSPAEPQSPDHEASHPEGKPAEPDLPPPDAPSQEPGNEL